MIQSALFEQETSEIVMRPLRPRQLEAIRQIKLAVASGHKRIILQAPTGFGKTRVAEEIIVNALRKGSRPLFTVPALTLIDQTIRSFELGGLRDIGVIQAQHPRTNLTAALQIASVQTLTRRGLPEFITFVLQDEAHEIFEELDRLLDTRPNLIVIGLTATPWTRGLGLRWTKLIVGATMRDMINEGYAREFTIYGPPHDIDRGAIAVKSGEFDDTSAAAAMSEATIVGDVLTEWKERSTHERTFAFCVTRDHAKAQIEAFADVGIPFGYIDANVPMGELDSERGTRKHIFAQMRNGEIAGIASVGCLIRGVDEVVTNILDLAPTKSEMRHVQKWGRMRTSDPNATYIGFDHAGNNQSLGMFWDIHHDTLDTRVPGERKEAFADDYKAAKPRRCPKCMNLVPPGVRQCATCLEKLPLHTGVTVKDGRLVEIGSGPKKPPVNKEHQDWYSQLVHLGKKAGFKPKWADYKFEARFGIKPDGLKPRGKSATSDDVKAFVAEQRKMYLASKKENKAAGKAWSV